VDLNDELVMSFSSAGLCDLMFDVDCVKFHQIKLKYSIIYGYIRSPIAPPMFGACNLLATLNQFMLMVMAVAYLKDFLQLIKHYLFRILQIFVKVPVVLITK